MRRLRASRCREEGELERRQAAHPACIRCSCSEPQTGRSLAPAGVQGRAGMRWGIQPVSEPVGAVWPPGRPKQPTDRPGLRPGAARLAACPQHGAGASPSARHSGGRSAARGGGGEGWGAQPGPALQLHGQRLCHSRAKLLVKAICRAMTGRHNAQHRVQAATQTAHAAALPRSAPSQPSPLLPATHRLRLAPRRSHAAAGRCS